MSRLQTSFVLGYHGCEKEVGLKAVQGQLSLAASKGEYDWIGAGIYFWESDPLRAYEWALQKQKRGHCNEPFVIGAPIDLRNCLDLLARENVELVKKAYDSFKEMQTKASLELPINQKAPKDKSDDLVMRYLDCAVFNHLHSMINQAGIQPYDTVRAVFAEGGPIFDGAKIFDKNHAQIAVLEPDCIRGLFLPLGVTWPDGAANNLSIDG